MTRRYAWCFVFATAALVGCSTQEQDVAAGSESQLTDPNSPAAAKFAQVEQLAQARAQGDVCDSEAYQSKMITMLREVRAEEGSLKDDLRNNIISSTLSRNILLRELTEEIKIERGTPKDDQAPVKITNLGAMLRKGATFYGPSAAAVYSELRINRNQSDSETNGNLALVTRVWDAEENVTVARKIRTQGTWKVDSAGSTITVKLANECTISERRQEGVKPEIVVPKKTASGAACEVFGMSASKEYTFSIAESVSSPSLVLNAEGAPAFWSEPSECDI